MKSSYSVFMKTDLSDYVGEWIVIVDDKIVSHGRDIKNVFEVAKEKYPNKRPLITKVPEKGVCIF